ncbi:MAG TPA: IPT/TIG domain-containing protein, partial [Acidimicrobiales bacterium]|nr:IPT/TIG domain-containing protein [Acidimicrobiales bacterium]
MTAKTPSRKHSYGGGVGALLAASLLIGSMALGLPWAVQAASGQISVSCTFNGKAAPTAITGVVPGTTTLAIVCTGTSGLGVAGLMASPLGGVVVSPAKAASEADLGTLTKFTESPAGTYKATFKVPSTFKASDTNAVCPPSPGQFNAGLAGCAVAVINTSTLSQFSGQEAILIDASQTAPPNSPTVATDNSEVTAGETISFGDATGACPSNPTAASDCWWGDALGTSSTSSDPATLTVTLDGSAVAGATATVAGPGTGGLATYNGTTLVPQSLSGTLTLPSVLAAGPHTLTVTQSNVTPFDGNGASPHAGSAISASTTLFVGPTTTPVVTGVSPGSGTSAGGTTVNISGSNFTGATAVHFGTAAATSVKVNSSTSISAVSPAGLGGVDVTVTTSKGTSLTSDADRFVYVAPAPPVITGLSPASGTQEGGTGVTVGGSGFTGSTSVKFGSTPAKSFKVLSDSQLVALSPAGSGVVDLVITNRVGTSAQTSADEYSYLPGPPNGPVVTAVDPSAGIAGTVVTVSGSGFSGATAVHFGSTAATAMSVVSDTTITAKAPAETGSDSPVDITVTTPVGTSATDGADQFSYVGAPVISSLSPATGSPVGGYQVSISGSAFTDATAVDFGSTPATSFTVGGDSSITATAPVGSGTVFVRVKTPAGTSAETPSAKFVFGAPTVSSVSPTNGSPQGGYSATISGTGFTGATAVDFGSKAATDVVVSSDDSLTATVPAGGGTVNVTVTTAAGTSAKSQADHFVYVGTPTITGVSPGEGPTSGGNLVTITGTSFTGATAVDFGSRAASDVTVQSDGALTAVVPAGTGTVDIKVTVPTGNTSASPPVTYTYVPVPTVTAVSPNTGLAAGGGPTVNITGSGFNSATLVSFGPNGTGSFTVNSDSSITVTPPGSPSGAGPVDVTVTNPGGISATSSADVYTYEALPSVTQVYPDAGPTSGGTSVVITGTGFTPSTTVDFGTLGAGEVTIVNSTLIEASSPGPASAGAVDVTVTSATGTSLTSGADQFTYQTAPTVTGVSPPNGPVGGGTSVTITGTNLLVATAVNFGGTASPSFTVDSATSITAIAPSFVSAGVENVTVVTTSGTSATSTADHFSYVAVPTITGVTPLQGPVSG